MSAATASAQPSDPTSQIVDPAALLPDVSPEKQARFVEVLSQWGNVRAAAAQAGVSRAHLYRMRRADAGFREMWDAALVLARPQVEEVLADRALNGIAESVYYHGEEVATRIRYDARLLLAHLARLDRVETARGVRAAVEDFDLRVELLRNGRGVSHWEAPQVEDLEEAEAALQEAMYVADLPDGSAEEAAPGSVGRTADAGEDESAPVATDIAASPADTAAPHEGATIPVLDSVSCVSNTSGPGGGAALLKGLVEPGAMVDASSRAGEQALLRGTSSEQGAGLMLKVRGDCASLGMTCSANP